MRRMARRLLAYLDGRHVGTFSEDASGRVGFEYEAGAPSPISLSLPLGGGWADDAPLNLLRNLLPDRSGDRAALRAALGAASTDPFDLLDRVDSAGGLVLSAREWDGEAAPGTVRPATAESLAARVEELSGMRGAAWWPDEDPGCRFSLAGSQGKFSLALFRGAWFWPSAGLPSTHIVKPPSPRVSGTVEVEDASMTVAGAAGARVPAHAIARLGGGDVASYVVGRFDRLVGPDGIATRLRSEDLLQALGRPPEDKYDVEAGEVLGLLVRADPTLSLSYEWLRQLMVCCSLGDGDAHAKNFSLLLDDAGARLSPMYDVLATGSWGDAYDRGLAIPLMNAFDYDGCFYPEYLTPGAWAREAESAGLDGERVADMARRVAGAVIRASEEVAERVPRGLRADFLGSIRSANERMDPIEPEGPDATPSTEPRREDALGPRLGRSPRLSEILGDSQQSDGTSRARVCTGPRGRGGER